MPADRNKKSFGRRVVVFMVGSDEPYFVTAAAAVSLVWGIILAFFIVYKNPGPTGPLWEIIAGGLLLGLVIMPGFFLAVSRMTRHISPWESLATMAAVSLCPMALWRLGARHGLGVNMFYIVAGCVAGVLGAFFTARALVKRHRRLAAKRDEKS
jgi:hypothetical protein